MSVDSFDGFTPETLKFLRQLKRNNDRGWFNENKQRYESIVREPALALIRDIEKPLKKVSDCFVAVAKKSGGSLMRPYRDIRFSKNKLPFKTNVGIHFRHEMGKDVHAPGFYLHIDPSEVFVGAGIWHPETSALTKIRSLIDDDAKRWKRVTGRKAFREVFERTGDTLKRPPRGFDEQHPQIVDLKRKDHIAICSLDTSELMDRNLIDLLIGKFKLAMPYVRFLCDALRLPS